MTNLFETEPLHPSEVHTGCVVYYADHHAFTNECLHALQVCKVIAADSKSFVLDNGKKFNPETGLEVTRGNGGVLYPYTFDTKAMVQDAQSKLFLINEVLSVDFSALTTQQLSMILDVSRGAFTQITAPTPCGGGCRDTVGKPSQQSFIDSLRANSYTADTVQVAGIDIDISDIESIPTVEAPIGIADATYELSDEDEDEDDEEYAGNEDYE